MHEIVMHNRSNGSALFDYYVSVPPPPPKKYPFVFAGPLSAPVMAWWQGCRASTLRASWTENGNSTAATTRSDVHTLACVYADIWGNICVRFFVRKFHGVQNFPVGAKIEL